MVINKNKEGSKLVLTLEGRLDTTTAPQLEKIVRTELSDIKELKMNFETLEYVSSAGLRVILSAQKMMNKQGEMQICNVNDMVMEVFDVTGFTDVLNIEQKDEELK